MKDSINSPDTGGNGLTFKNAKLSGHVNKSF